MVHALLKRLRENHLEALLKAIETKGGHPGECVMMPQSDADIQSAPPFLLCKLYRWNDLQPSAQLKVLCHCKSFHAVDSAQVCCNPYHYSRLCGPGKLSEDLTFTLQRTNNLPDMTDITQSL